MRIRILTEPQQGATYAQLLTLAQLSEHLGFDAFFRSDHYLAMGDSDGVPGPTDAWVTLAALGRETKRIRLGTLVTPVTFRFPGPLAISVAQADEMSGGRIELGIGAGWYDTEHRAHGIPFPPTGERLEMLEDQLAILAGLWETPPGKTFTYEGRRHSVVDSPGLPKPRQEPRPPIVMGGYGATRTPRLAARYADEFNLPFPPLPYYREGCDHVRRACEAQDRDPASMRFTVALVACVAQDDATLARRAAAIGREPGELRENGAAGTAAEAVERIRAYADAGAETVYLQVLDLEDLDHVRLIAAEVAPHLAEL
ncbi:MAG: TIGR03560 family F420-dependent LLM class oxidoreductase [Actinomycetota bacterium]